MKPNLRIAIGMSISFSISFTIFFVAMDQLKKPPGGYISPTEFYSQSFDPSEKKIYILGSSHAGVINSTYINQYLSQLSLDRWHVYNLAKSADLPSYRLAELDGIISTNPTVVLYVVGIRDFEKSTNQNNLGDIPNPVSLVNEVVSTTQFIDYDFNEIRNPKLITLRTISELLSGNNQTKALYDQDSPFYPINVKQNARITDDSELRNQSKIEPDFMGIDPANAKPLKKIISSLEQENIKVVLVTSPYNKWYLNEIPDNDQDAFIELTNNISDELGIPLHIFFDKYANLNIWRDIQHVSTNKDALIFSKDIAEIILSEIN